MFTLIRNFKTINRYHKSLDAPELTFYLLASSIFQVGLAVWGGCMVFEWSLNNFQAVVLGTIVGLVFAAFERKVIDVVKEAKEWLD